MKKLIYLPFVALFALSSCTDMLIEDNKVKVTTNYLYTTVDGIEHGAVGLYERDRDLIVSDEGAVWVSNTCDGCTDLVVFRGGNAAALNRLVNFTESNDLVRKFWENRYTVIGKANEVIYSAENNLGLDNPDPRVKRAWAEAKLFRARCYFDLYRRFDRLYLNTRPTTIGNLNRIYKPAKTEDIFEIINQDLSDAMVVLDWTPSHRGRMTKAVAKHVRAQVAQWQGEWDTVIKHTTDIFVRPEFEMNDNAIDCFTGADAATKEVLMAYQFSANIGGGNTVSSGSVTGHRVSLNVTPVYHKLDGFQEASDLGGYGWGRFYPNTYLFSLYDPVKDTRFENLFKKEWHYNKADPGITIGDVAAIDPTKYLESLHPCTRKYFDSWTNADMPQRTSSYKDIVLYRLAETYLMAAEAYMMKYGGGDINTVMCYNKTWERAGNDPVASITLEDLVDEYARELNFEGIRWYQLKRLGILEARVKLHYGNSRAEDPKLGEDVIHARTNMTSKYTRWPIPLSALDQMGRENFPQNSGWE